MVCVLLVAKASDVLIVRFNLYDIVVGYKFLVKFAFLLALIIPFNKHIYQTLCS